MDEQRYRQAEQRLFADAGIAPAERFIALPSLGVRARILEVGEGAPVLFQHGGPNAGATWAYVVAGLRGVRCILLDRPGCGLSERPRETPDHRTLAGYVSQLTADVLDALGLGRASLVGSSFGGYAALRSSIALSDRVDRVILAGCPAFVPGWTAPGFFSLLRTPVVGKLVQAMPATRGSMRMSLKQMGEHQALQAKAIPAPMLEWIFAWQRYTDTMRNDAAMILAAGRWRQGFDPALDLTPADLSRVDVPVLIASGTDDPVGGEPVISNLAELLPRATVEMFPSAGHLPWLSSPARFCEAVSAFVGSESPATG